MSHISISPRRAETRQRLLDGAVGVFADRGVLAASVEEICDRAGFTRGAFYSNYGSKNELVLALLEQDRERQRAMVAGWRSPDWWAGR
ncbi:TetR/AcrR family transcriptional regulator [Raineyella fluvialis]|uniref:TetR family transcriptional regulator n=1 Tax=Raineyella fluvialis TaxID=2662261 RepID=A0A5Q2FG13_9ACTN|nr:TetR family transcriptional regulator [Raineyella fluvialis]